MKFKPVLKWAIVHADDGELCRVVKNIVDTRLEARLEISGLSGRAAHRVIRVEIREAKKGKR